MNVRVIHGSVVLALIVSALATAPAVQGQTVPAASANSSWKNIGPPGGWIESVAVDPITTSTVYAGTEAGGVFKSTNSGGRWTLVGLAGDEIRALAVDPSNDSVVYALNPFGLFVSTDAGASWTFNAALGSVSATALAVDPADGSILYVASQDAGVYKSSDGGASWTAANSGLTPTQVNDLAIAPSNPARLYAATPSGVFTSTNSAGSWAAVNTGLTDTNIQSVAVNPANASSVWAMTAIPQFTFGVQSTGFHTTNGGASWSADGAGLPGAPNTLKGLINVPLIVSGGTVYAGLPGFGVYAESKTGSTWSAVNSGLTDPDGLATQFVFGLAANPAHPAQLFAASTDGGLFRSTDAAGSWAPANTGLLANQIIALAGVPSEPNQLYAATGQLGLFVSTDGGASWASATQTAGAQVNAITVDPSNPATVWAGGSGIFKTTDNGASWTANPGGQGGFPAFPVVTGVAVDPFDSNTVWAAVLGAGVYETTDGGTSWTAMNSGLSNLEVSAIAADPKTAGLLYVGTRGAGVFTSTDGGGSWTQMSTAGLPSNPQVTFLIDDRLTIGGEGEIEYYNPIVDDWLPSKFYENGKSISVYTFDMWCKGPWCAVLTEQGLFVSPNGGVSFYPLSEIGVPPNITQILQLTALVAGVEGDPFMAVGTAGNDIYIRSSTVPILTQSRSTSTAGSVTATVPNGTKPSRKNTLSATASSGTGKLTISDYFANPSAIATAFTPGVFFGLSLSSTNTFQSVTVTDCQSTDSKTSVQWLNGSSWSTVSNQAYQTTTGCMSITVNGTTTPSLTDLTNAVFVNKG